jgi:hypothetical protein
MSPGSHVAAEDPFHTCACKKKLTIIYSEAPFRHFDFCFFYFFLIKYATFLAGSFKTYIYQGCSIVIEIKF